MMPLELLVVHVGPMFALTTNENPPFAPNDVSFLAIVLFTKMSNV
jgi:hypothetical protein